MVAAWKRPVFVACVPRQMVEEWKVRRAAGAPPVPVTLGAGAGVGACDSDGEAAATCPAAGGGAGAAMAAAVGPVDVAVVLEGGGRSADGAVPLGVRASNAAA
jgi:hypothetical protein